MRTIGSLVVMGVVIGVLTATGALASPDTHLASIDAAGICSQTTRAANKACLDDADNEALVSLGNCLNLTDPVARQACMDDRDEALAEARALCAAQTDARSDVCDDLGEAAYDPVIDPADFNTLEQTEQHPNPYFPLVRGNHWTYAAGTETTDVLVLPDTKVILGVTCFVVHDAVSDNGVLIEDTYDWYQQDHDGNLWYFGELSVEYEDGQIAGIGGSWTGGIDYAKPGIIMQAAPQVGEVYRQEYSIANAEDMGEVLSITASEHSPAASCTGDCVATHDFTALEPHANEHKFYAPGVGEIVELLTDGSREELTSFTPGAAAPGTTGSLGTLHNVRVNDRSNVGRTDARIAYSLASASRVQAQVFDASGRVVRAIDGGLQGAGEHALVWDGTDGGGQRATRGIYFVRLSAGIESVTHRVVLSQ